MTPRSQSHGWVFVDAQMVPARLRERSRPVLMVPMLAEELEQLLDGDPMGLALDPTDERLAELVAAGRTLSAISRELGLSLRGVQRRLARLRARFDCASTAELGAFLAARGFALARTGTALSQETARRTEKPSPEPRPPRRDGDAREPEGGAR